MSTRHFADEMLGYLHTLERAMLTALGTAAESDDRDQTAVILPATYHVHLAIELLLDYLAEEIKPSGSEESTGQIDDPGSDPDPRGQDFELEVLAWIKALERQLLARLGEAADYELFVDYAVPAALSLGEARQLLEGEEDAEKKS